MRRILLAPNNKATRYALLVVALSLLACAASCAPQPAKPGSQATAPQPQAAPSQEAEVSIYHGVGIVTKINATLPSIEINHEEIQGLMPPMIMEWYVKDVSLLKSIKTGDKVEFTLEVPKRGTETISELKKR